MKIHAVQLDIAWEDRLANHKRVRCLLEQASIRPGDIIVLPEMFDVGFSMNTTSTRQSTDLPSEAFLQDLAVSTRCLIIAGVVSDESIPGNEAIVVNPTGSVVCRYRKTHCFSFAQEDRHYQAGDEIVVCSWQGIVLAPFICYDLRFPEIYRQAASAGAELLVTLANWPATRILHWETLLQARAIENQAFALGVNRCGRDPHFHYPGRSSLISPLGKTLFRCDNEERVVSFPMDIEQVRKWRGIFPALRDKRPPLAVITCD